MKQLVLVSNPTELRKEEGKLYVCHCLDSCYDGNIRYEGDTTLSKYSELRHESSNTKHKGIFFAFSDKQFNEGLAEIGFDPKDEASWKGKVFRSVGGMFGTREGLDAFYQHCFDANKRIATECDPQEVYVYEWSNHECQYSDDHSAYEIVKDIFGEEIAKQIKRI